MFIPSQFPSRMKELAELLRASTRGEDETFDQLVSDLIKDGGEYPIQGKGPREVRLGNPLVIRTLPHVKNARSLYQQGCYVEAAQELDAAASAYRKT